jgi:hypothetical protein
MAGERTSVAQAYYEAPLASYDGSSILASVLIVRSENEFWSRAQDAETLAGHFE